MKGKDQLAPFPQTGIWLQAMQVWSTGAGEFSWPKRIFRMANWVFNLSYGNFLHQRVQRVPEALQRPWILGIAPKWPHNPTARRLCYALPPPFAHAWLVSHLPSPAHKALFKLVPPSQSQLKKGQVLQSLFQVCDLSTEQNFYLV